MIFVDRRKRASVLVDDQLVEFVVYRVFIRFKILEYRLDILGLRFSLCFRLLNRVDTVFSHKLDQLSLIHRHLLRGEEAGNPESFHDLQEVNLVIKLLGRDLEMSHVATDWRLFATAVKGSSALLEAEAQVVISEDAQLFDRCLKLLLLIVELVLAHHSAASLLSSQLPTANPLRECLLYH